MISKIQLFKILFRHIRLSEKRSEFHKQNKVAKVVIYVMTAFAFVYMMSIAVMFALIANDSETRTPAEFFFGLMPFFIVADFLFRFMLQQTPAQRTKPYSLLPIPKYTCIEMFVISSIISPKNLIWTAITIPYAIMTTLFSEGIMSSLASVLSFQIIISINSLWYMAVRTLINHSVRWWILPVAVYGLVFLPLILGNYNSFFNTYGYIGAVLTHWNPVGYLILALVLWAFFEVNKRMQFHFTYQENAEAEPDRIKNLPALKTFDRYGETGEYIKLEVKSVIRNKNQRKSFLFCTIFVTLLSLVISFTDIYETGFFRSFWVVYTFILYGEMMLIKIMSAEGNYIDCLMVHKENIIRLLEAKYYFYSAMLVLPIFLMLPTVFTGKYTLLMLMSMACFAAGPVYCLIMQMAVYNKQTIPLNTKLISKGSVETNYFQLVANLLSMFVPVAVISVLRGFIGENLTYTVMLFVGLAFIVTHKLWIRNIYKRFMAVRYNNMESFRASR